MKRIVMLLLCAVMIFSVCACGKTVSDTEENGTSAETETAVKSAPDAGNAAAPGADEALGITDRRAVYEVIVVDCISIGKLQLVKYVHDVTGCSLKQARDTVEDCMERGNPISIKKCDTMEEAKAMEEELYDIGARVQIRECYQ